MCTLSTLSSCNFDWGSTAFHEPRSIRFDSNLVLLPYTTVYALLFIITLPYNESLLAYRLTRSYRVLELPSLITVRWNRRISFTPSLTPPIFPLTGHSCARYANFYRSPRFIDSSVDGNRVVRRVRGAGARRRRSGPSSQRIIIMNEHGRQTRGPASSALDRSAVRIIGAER